MKVVYEAGRGKAVLDIRKDGSIQCERQHKPILFNTDMVRALLDGRKTVTRRVVKFPPGLTGSHQVGEAGNPDNPLGLMWACGIKRPPYQPGDILYVRETWDWSPCAGCGDNLDCDDCVSYKGEWGCFGYRADSHAEPYEGKWRPSIHMPKEAARIFLRVTDVRVERLQEISEQDCVNEGGYAIEAVQAVGIAPLFGSLWDSTIKPTDRARYGWEANPWVWVIEFERISREEIS